MGKISKSVLMAFISMMAEESTKSINISMSPMEMMAERKNTYGLRKRRFSKGGNNRILSHHKKRNRR